MAGELSKKSGEYGEEIAKKLLRMIGWSDPPYGYDIECHNHKYHSIGEGDRKTHGIDISYNYESPLISNRQESTVVSVKYRDNYPSSPTSEFKEFLKELVFAIECFRYHPQYLQNISSSIESKGLNGIIIWLSRNDSHKKTIVSNVKDFRISGSFEYGPIYLVDNLHASFLYSVIKKCKTVYKDNYQFVYQTTGVNLSSLDRKTFGSILPIEHINSPILLVKGTNRKDDILNIFCIERFSPEELKRLIGLSRDITEQWASKIIIYFSQYKRFEDENTVNTVKALFTDKNLTSKIVVKKITIESFRELENVDE
jgi:hypothetical protein